MQFAATLIQWAYRRHLRWIAALELDACSRIEVAFLKHLRASQWISRCNRPPAFGGAGDVCPAGV